MKKRIFTSLMIFSLSVFQANAAPSINDMQGCQAYLDFVDKKLDAVTEQYPQADIDMIRQGLNAYNQYIQSEIITPGLLQFNQQDSDKTQDMQTQIDAYKTQVTQSLIKRYQQYTVVTDYPVAINECAKKAVPAGDDLTALKNALLKLVALAKQG